MPHMQHSKPSQESHAADFPEATWASAKRKRIPLAPRKKEIRRWVGEGRSDEWIASALGTTPSSVQSFRSRSGIMRVAGAGSSRISSSRPEDSLLGSESGGEFSTEFSTYEGVLEHGEDEGYGLWLDPAVADDPVFQSGFGGVRDVEVRIGEDRIVLRPLDPLTQATSSTSFAAPDKTEEPERASANAPGQPNLQEMVDSLPDPGGERGTVKWFEPTKGYGFIRRPAGGEIFVHKSEVRGGDTLEAGAEVAYEVAENERGPVATGVRILG